MEKERKPKGYWTFERCKEEALKYNTRTDFYKNSISAYVSARKNKWLDEICSNMIELIKQKGYWTKEKCAEEALKYEMRFEFQQNNISAYRSAHKNKWLDEICSHMIIINNPSGYWSYNRCTEDALKYNSRYEFQKESNSAYSSAKNNGWLDDICSHMIIINKPSGYWNKEKCQEEAIKYTSKSEFCIKSRHLYNISRKNNWLVEICLHMKPQGSRYKRCIYVYEFSDKHAYVGLTYDIEKRHKQHITDINRTIYKYILKTELTPIRKQLTEYIDKDEASILEGVYKQQYIENGWNILNISKTGGLGGNIYKWTYENCKEEANKYETRKEFSIKSSSAYNSARKNKWLTEICFNMKLYYKSNYYWNNIENCKIEALKYKTKTDFIKKSRYCYNISRKNGFLDEICQHMKKRGDK